MIKTHSIKLAKAFQLVHDGFLKRFEVSFSLHYRLHKAQGGSKFDRSAFVDLHLKRPDSKLPVC